MSLPITDDLVASLRSASGKLTGHRRRGFQAEMAWKYCGGSPRKAEDVSGWRRTAVELGLNELRTGIRCIDNAAARGRKKTEEKHPQIAQRIEQIVEPAAQADPKFQTRLAYTRITAERVREELLNDEALAGSVPSRQTVGEILGRMGYSLRRVQKTRPEKKSQKPTPSSTTSKRNVTEPPPNRTRFESP